jgi:hypothetical protein
MPFVEIGVLVILGVSAFRPKKALMAGKLLKKLVDAPSKVRMKLPNGKTVEVQVGEFIGDDSKLHTAFAIHVVMANGKKLPIALTKAETELLHQASFFRAMADQGESPTPEQLRRLAQIIDQRLEEVKRNKRRHVKVLK